MIAPLGFLRCGVLDEDAELEYSGLLLLVALLDEQEEASSGEAEVVLAGVAVVDTFETELSEVVDEHGGDRSAFKTLLVMYLGRLMVRMARLLPCRSC